MSSNSIDEFLDFPMILDYGILLFSKMTKKSQVGIGHIYTVYNIPEAQQKKVQARATLGCSIEIHIEENIFRHF